ncbi:MAG: integrin alpha [Thaumarchaeota archaeon]|nr:integrin alpha [Nitrososphaerota archaeon]
MIRALLGTTRVATAVLVLAAVAATVAAAGASHHQEAHASSAPFQYAQSTVKIHNGSIPALTLNDHDAFGSGVDFVGDVNGDGVPDLIVGA